MPTPFTRSFRVRWSEVDANGQVGPASFLRYLVETAWDWGTTADLWTEETQALGILWVIRETEINLLRPLHHNDRFDFTIWLANWKRVRGTRSFELRRAGDGELIAEGTQEIACLDHATFRPMSLPETFMDKFRVDPPRVFPAQKFPKVPAPPPTAHMTHRQVEWQDLDEIRHVNNAVYATYVAEAAAQALAAAGWPPARLAEQGLAMVDRRLHIQYQSPALWGEKLEVVTYLLGLADTGGSRYVGIKRAADGTGIIECLTTWQLVDRVTGAAQPLPTSLATALRAELAAPI